TPARPTVSPIPVAAPPSARATETPERPPALQKNAPVATTRVDPARPPLDKNARRAPPNDRAADDTPVVIPSFARKPEPPARAPAAARPADASTRSARMIDWLTGALPPKHRARVREYLVLMRLDRPVGALLLLWPTWWALWFAANDFPPIGALLIFTLGVFVMRSAGCVINDYADHGWLDANVERTRGRPMAAGRVSKKEALLLFGGLLGIAFVLVLFTNALTIKLSIVGAALAAVYPFTKRVTHLAQVVLGAAFGWAIPMAFAAVTNSLPPLCWLLFLANVLFSTVYDTEYAMVDRDDDVRVGAKSTAILFGDADRAAIGVLMVTFVLAMLLAGTRAALHWPYFVGLAVAAGLFGYQQTLIRDRSREHCFAAFRNNNLVGLVLWLGLLFALAIR
ncbi:MAG: 4-hydroxybenzoate octaprenyltransferase, partial [Dokdonella sp.]|uniref:4-hydroxybenzoate octaprenyltransferase n=1 Tax=Dokdonella sp. TaxID=2291710 RepID=UPI003263B174